ncbi:DUF2292 domain-containing protein [Planctomicrobium sp. SH668]|uniref:DUF2292 domain-containing protein n=1 Tax=Planctomicrobium sp. SH668 TaxID=3448126 RepID=UPI003F5B2BBC
MVTTGTSHRADFSLIVLTRNAEQYKHYPIGVTSVAAPIDIAATQVYRSLHWSRPGNKAFPLDKIGARENMTEQISVANGKATHRVKEQNLDKALNQVREALNGLRYGQVTAVVQDGVVVQVERIEKKRIV